MINNSDLIEFTDDLDTISSKLLQLSAALGVVDLKRTAPVLASELSSLAFALHDLIDRMKEA